MRDVYVLRNKRTGAVLAVATRWERASLESAACLADPGDLAITNHDLLEDDD